MARQKQNLFVRVKHVDGCDQPFYSLLRAKDDSRITVDYLNQSYPPNKYLKVKGNEPSLKTLEKYTMDSVCKATDGCRVEPDGVCIHGHPSWLLALNLI